MSPSTILHELVVVHADYDLWSGEVRLAEADIKLGVGGELPPDRVAKLGSKSICDPRALKTFRTLKTATRRMLQGYGLPFLTGWAVPRARLAQVLEHLEADRQKFSEAKQRFLSNYDSTIEAWIADNPGYEQAIRSAVLEREDVARRLDFNYQVFHIQPVTGEPAAEQRLAEQASGLAGELLREIERDAEVFYSRYLRGKTEVRAYSRRSLESLAVKVDGLSFLSGVLGPVVKLLRDTAQGYHQHVVNGRIGAPFFFQIHSAVLILMDARKMQDYAAGNGLDPAVPADVFPALSVPLAEVSAPGVFPAMPAPAVPEAKVVNGLPARGMTLPLDLDALLGDFESFVAGATAQPPIRPEPYEAPAPQVFAAQAGVPLCSVQAREMLMLDEDNYF